MSEAAKEYLKDKSCDRVRGEEPYHTEMYYKNSVELLMQDYSDQQNKELRGLLNEWSMQYQSDSLGGVDMNDLLKRTEQKLKQ